MHHSCQAESQTLGHGRVHQDGNSYPQPEKPAFVHGNWMAIAADVVMSLNDAWCKTAPPDEGQQLARPHRCGAIVGQRMVSE